MRQGFHVLDMNRLLDPEIESDLMLTLVGVQNVLPTFHVTFRHVTRSWLDPGFYRIPVTPAVGSTARDVQVLFAPCRKASIFVLYVVAGTLRSELVTQPIEHWSQILLGEFFVFLPSSLNSRLEFLFV